MAAQSFYGPPGTGPSYYGPPGGAGGPSYYGPPGGAGSFDPNWGAVPSAAPSTIFKISACARNFPKMDGLLGKADPYLVVSVAGGAGRPKKVLTKTEVVKNDLNPTWQPFEVNATEAGGESTPLLWEAFDWDADGEHDFIGSFTASLQQMTPSAKFTFLNPAKKSTFGRAKPESGELNVIRVEREQRAAKPPPKAVRLCFRGEKLAKKDIVSSDPFLVFWATPLPSASGLPHDQMAAAPHAAAAASSSAAAPGAAPRVQVIIAKTEVVPKNLNPTWQPIDIAVELTGGLDAKMTVICWDFDSDGTHDEIGRCVVSLRELMQKDPMIPLIDPAKKGSVGYSNSGVLRVSYFEEIPQGPPEPKPLAYDLSISCSKLARMDATGKSDPFLQISARVPVKQKEGKAVIYKSEILHQVLSGPFRPFQLTIVDCGGLDNPLTFEVYDKDVRGQELIGGFKTTLRELSFQKSNIFHLVNKAHKLSRYSGIITVDSCVPSHTITPTGVFAPAYRIRAAGKQMFKPNNGFAIYAGSKTGPLLYKSPEVAHNLNPLFEPFVIATQQAGGLDGPLYFEWTSSSKKKGRPVGNFTTTLRELNMYKTSPLIPVIDPKKNGRVGYRSSGDFEIQLVEPVFDDPSRPPAGPNLQAWGAPPAHGAPAPQPGWGAPAPGGWGAPPTGPAPGPGGWGAPPTGPAPGAGGWGAPPSPGASAWGAPPPAGAAPGAWGAPPPGQPAPGGWGAPPPGQPAPGGWGAPPPGQPAPGGWGAPPPGQPAGGQPAPGGWGAPPPGQPAGGQPAPGGWGAPPPGQPAPGGWGAAPPGQPAPGGWGAPPPGQPAPGGWGAPPSGPPGAYSSAPAGAWGAPPAGGAPAPGSPGGWGAPPPGSHESAPPGAWGGQPAPGSAPPGAWGQPAPGGWGAPPPGQQGAPGH